MEDYIGRKCKGFKFEHGTDKLRWNKDMEKHIGKVGVITDQDKDDVRIEFENDYWYYPLSLIEEHLIPKIPEIPQLGEGVEMEVSNDGIDWCKRKVIAQRHDGKCITGHVNLWAWNYARPIPEVKKYTKEELIKIVGHDFEII
jgi:hypothetical protein